MKRSRQSGKNGLTPTKENLYEHIGLPATRAFIIAKMNGATDSQARMASSSATIAYLTAMSELIPRQIAWKTIKAVAIATPSAARATHMLVPSIETDQEKNRALSVAATMIGRAAANSIPYASKKTKQDVDMMTKQQIIEDTLFPKREMQGSGFYHPTRGGSSDFSWLSYTSGGGDLDNTIIDGSDGAFGFTYRNFLLAFFPVRALIDRNLNTKDITNRIVRTNDPDTIYAISTGGQRLHPRVLPETVYLPVTSNAASNFWSNHIWSSNAAFTDAIEQLRADAESGVDLEGEALQVAQAFADLFQQIKQERSEVQEGLEQKVEDFKKAEEEREQKKQQEKALRNVQNVFKTTLQNEGEHGSKAAAETLANLYGQSALLETLLNPHGRTYAEAVASPAGWAYYLALAKNLFPDFANYIAEGYNAWGERADAARDFKFKQEARKNMMEKKGFQDLSKTEQQAVIYDEYKRLQEEYKHKGKTWAKDAFWWTMEKAGTLANEAIDKVFQTATVQTRRNKAVKLQEQRERIDAWGKTIGAAIATVASALPAPYNNAASHAALIATEASQLFGPSNAAVNAALSDLQRDVERLKVDMPEDEKVALMTRITQQTNDLKKAMAEAKYIKQTTGLNYENYKGEVLHQQALRKEELKQVQADTKKQENTARQQEKENDATNQQNANALEAQAMALKNGSYLTSYTPPSTISFAPRVVPASPINRISPLNTNGIRSLSSLNGSIASHTLKDAKSFMKAAVGARGVSGVSGINSFGEPEKKRGRKGDDSDNDDNDGDSGYKGKPGRKSKFHRYISKVQKETAKARKKAEKQKEKDEKKKQKEAEKDEKKKQKEAEKAEKKKQKEAEKAEKKKQKETEKAEKKQKETFSDAQKAVLLDLIKQAASAAV